MPYKRVGKDLVYYDKEEKDSSKLFQIITCIIVVALCIVIMAISIRFFTDTYLQIYRNMDEIEKVKKQSNLQYWNIWAKGHQQGIKDEKLRSADDTRRN